ERGVGAALPVQRGLFLPLHTPWSTKAHCWLGVNKGQQSAMLPSAASLLEDTGSLRCHGRLTWMYCGRCMCVFVCVCAIYCSVSAVTGGLKAAIRSSVLKLAS